MATSILLHSPFLPSRTCIPVNKTRYLKRHSNTLLVLACKRDGIGHMVDENMIVLRKRIHETKMVEMNYEPPSHWMDWEKRCYASYDECVYEAMGVLQSGLMNMRPSLALGLLILVTLSVAMSTLEVFSYVIDITKVVLS